MKALIILAGVALAGTGLAQVPAGSRYVAMGSSYSAGPGVGTPDSASGQCARSMSNFARQVASGRHLTLTDVSCSGATTDNILVHGQHGFSAQIEAVTPDTKLVSILIGGNDIDYVGNLGGLSCRDTGGTNCHVADPASIESKLAALPARLDQVVAEVRRRAPAARIVLVGYLPAVPANGAGCAALPLSIADIGRIRGVAIRLAQAIGGAAARNHVGVVRSSEIGTGHDACSASPYIAGYHAPRTPNWPSPVAYHPNQAGMDRIAQALDAAIGG
ncbi:SGNH/GDSL hydrolase family protein [uncultured Sphingomonas sp.]|uniref:SGNH/GDSL hydrolase family protein n=1 Tax=uncultured Sphingomonas sp. TaxID=158754 RepID=UPI002609E870|nr:SGNH/GDSL hydrolase family protein [uncultured Sphingomonas sp.]